jgi:hypothetical protein
MKCHRQHRGVDVWLYSFLIMAVDGSEWSAHAPAALSPGKNHGTHRIGEFVVHRTGFLFGEKKLLPLLGFKSRTVQLVASGYTDYCPGCHIVITNLYTLTIYLTLVSRGSS